MKASNYNYSYYQNNTSYWMNGITRSYFTLPSNIGKELEELLKDPACIENLIPSLYTKLKSWGFIVKKDTNELEIIHSLQQANY